MGRRSSISLSWRCGWSHSITEWGWPLQPCGVNVASFTFKLSPLEWLHGQLPQPYARTHLHATEPRALEWNAFTFIHLHMSAPTHAFYVYTRSQCIRPRTRTHSLTLTVNHMLPWHPLPTQTLYIGPVRLHQAHNMPFTWEDSTLITVNVCREDYSLTLPPGFILFYSFLFFSRTIRFLFTWLTPAEAFMDGTITIFVNAECVWPCGKSLIAV